MKCLYAVTDEVTLTDVHGLPWIFKATMGFAEDRQTKTIQSGTICYFLMTSEDDDDVICLYEDGEWTIQLNDENEEDLASLARYIFLGKWNHNRKRGKTAITIEREEKQHER